MCLDFLYNMSETFFILRRIERNMIKKFNWPSCKVTLYSRPILTKLNYFDRFSKNTQIQNCIKIRPVGAESLQAVRLTGGRTWRKEWSFLKITRKLLIVYFAKNESLENRLFASCTVCLCYAIYKEPLPILHRCFTALYQYGHSLLSQRSYRLFKY